MLRPNAGSFLPLLLLFGFAFNFKPSEPYLTPFLLQYKGLTPEQLIGIVFPAGSYAEFFSLLAFALLAFTRCRASPGKLLRSVLFVGAFARLADRALLIFASGLSAICASEVLYGVSTAAEVVYFASAYYMAPVSAFSSVTALSRGATLAAHFSAAILGQALVAADVTIPSLFVLSFACVAVSVAVLAVVPFPPDVPAPSPDTWTVLAAEPSPDTWTVLAAEPSPDASHRRHSNFSDLVDSAPTSSASAYNSSASLPPFSPSAHCGPPSHAVSDVATAAALFRLIGWPFLSYCALSALHGIFLSNATLAIDLSAGNSDRVVQLSGAIWSAARGAGLAAAAVIATVTKSPDLAPLELLQPLDLTAVPLLSGLPARASRLVPFRTLLALASLACVAVATALAHAPNGGLLASAAFVAFYALSEGALCLASVNLAYFVSTTAAHAALPLPPYAAVFCVSAAGAATFQAAFSLGIQAGETASGAAATTATAVIFAFIGLGYLILMLCSHPKRYPS
jgi:hypothetical protein